MFLKKREITPSPSLRWLPRGLPRKLSILFPTPSPQCSPRTANSYASLFGEFQSRCCLSPAGVSFLFPLPPFSNLLGADEDLLRMDSGFPLFSFGCGRPPASALVREFTSWAPFFWLESLWLRAPPFSLVFFSERGPQPKIEDSPLLGDMHQEHCCSPPPSSSLTI